MCAKYKIYFTKCVQNTLVKLIFTIYGVQNTKYNIKLGLEKMTLKQLKFFLKLKILFFVCKLLCQEKKIFFCVQKTIYCVQKQYSHRRVVGMEEPSIKSNRRVVGMEEPSI